MWSPSKHEIHRPCTTGATSAAGMSAISLAMQIANPVCLPNTEPFVSPYFSAAFKAASLSIYSAILHCLLCPFKSDLHLCGAQINLWPSFSSPTEATSLPDTLPPGSPQAGPVLRVQNISHKPLVAHSPCRSPRSRIKHRAGVAGAVRAKAVDLQRPAIVQMPGHRTPDNGNAYDFFSIGQPDGEFMPHHRPVVPVVLFNVCVGFLECHWTELKHPSSPPMLSPPPRG